MSHRGDPRVRIVAGAAAETTAPSADVEIDARASARELRALSRPEARTGTSGAGVHENRISARRNMPNRLDPGETYRGVAIRRRVAGRLTGAGPDRASSPDRTRNSPS